MIRHIVLFRIKPEYKEEIPQIVETLLSMKGRIEGMTDFCAGSDILGSDRSFDVGLIATFSSREAFDAYADHPAHRPVKARMHQVRSDSVACDFEI